MNRGFYTAVQSMINQQRIIDAISNNVSNANTAGYRKDEIVLNTFQDQMFLVSRRTKLSGTSYQAYVDVSKTNLEQGGFEFTNSPFDAAIYGNMYFNVRYEKDDEVYQTRNGQWGLDDEGYLYLGGVGRVQGENGDIYIGNDDFRIDELGVVRDNQNQIIDTLLLTYIPPQADVHKEGDTLMRYDGDPMAIPEDEEYVVVQGAYEKSNVDSVKEMTQAMEAYRMYEASSKVVKGFDTINQKVTSRLIDL